MPELEKKSVMVEAEVWEKVEDLGKQPGQQRAANHQAGVILKEYFETLEAAHYEKSN